MKENPSSVLATNLTQNEEKITAPATLTTFCCILLNFIIYFVLFICLLISSKIIQSIIFLVLALICSCAICCVKSDYEIIINNSNRTMILISKYLLKCCGTYQETIDLNQVTKLNIYIKKTRRNGHTRRETIYKLYYKNGSSNDVTYFFGEWGEKNLYNCLNLLKKYFIIDCDDFPELKSNVELTNSDFCSMTNQEMVYNSNMMPNQVNNNITPQNFNNGIPQNVQQSYSSGGGIYANVNNESNTSYPQQSDL